MSRGRRSPRATERIHLRLAADNAEALERQFRSRSDGIRAAIDHVVDAAPLDGWADTGVSTDLDGCRIKRVSVRVSPAQLRALSRVVEAADVSRSRAIRDGVREVLRG